MPSPGPVWEGGAAGWRGLAWDVTRHAAAVHATAAPGLGHWPGSQAPADGGPRRKGLKSTGNVVQTRL